MKQSPANPPAGSLEDLMSQLEEEKLLKNMTRFEGQKYVHTQRPPIFP
jgi:hypothetical protein